MLHRVAPFQIVAVLLLAGIAMVAAQLVSFAQSDTGSAGFTVGTLAPDQTYTPPPATTVPTATSTKVPHTPPPVSTSTTKVVSTLPKTGAQTGSASTTLITVTLIAGAAVLLTLAAASRRGRP